MESFRQHFAFSSPPCCISTHPHLAIRRLLLELDAEPLKSLASDLNIVDADGDVAEALWLLVAIVVTLEAAVILGAVVVRQLEDAFTSEACLCLLLLGLELGSEARRHSFSAYSIQANVTLTHPG